MNRRRLTWIAILLVLSALAVLLYLRVIPLPAEAARTGHRLFNYAEAGVWAAAGIYVLRRSRPAPRGFAATTGQPRARRRLGAVASSAFFLFAASDLVETRTGAWYRPWWLLAWKATCVVILLSCLGLHARRRRGEAGE